MCRSFIIEFRLFLTFVVDLRYVPDDVTFDDEPHSKATQLPVDYECPFFVNNTVGHTKVTSSWDENDPERQILNGVCV